MAETRIEIPANCRAKNCVWRSNDTSVGVWRPARRSGWQFSRAQAKSDLHFLACHQFGGCLIDPGPVTFFLRQFQFELARDASRRGYHHENTISQLYRLHQIVRDH